MTGSSHNFCPELHTRSPPFTVQNGNTVLPQQTLNLFDTLSLPGSTPGVLAFLGGPVHALHWNANDTHLAVGVHRTTNPVHQLMEVYQGVGHLQVWSVQPGARSMAISHLIPHNGDCAWDLKWRPECSTETSTLAAALANGHVVLYHLAFLHLDASSSTQNVSSEFELIPQSVPQICLRGPHGSPDTVRALQWSPKGDNLATGTVYGCIELYRVMDDDTAEPRVVAQLIVRVRAHESAISSMRWLDANVLCSAGLDGTQRVRDVRDCLTELERVSDGPAWNLSLVNPENHVIMSGSDGGVLRIARLGTMSPTAEVTEMKKTRVSLASLRDLAVMPYTGRRGGQWNALFVGGGEGKLSVGPLPCPLWRRSGCIIRKTRFRPVLQWVADNSNIPEISNLEIGKDQAQKELNSETNDALDDKESCGLYQIYHSPLLLRLTHTMRTKVAPSSRMNSKKGYPTIPIHANLCAEKYDQRVVITRLALAKNGSMIATGNHAGFLTVLPVSDDMVLGTSAAAPRKSTNETPLGSTPRVKKKQNIPVQVEIVKKKRGRPRKYPRTNASANSPVGKTSGKSNVGNSLNVRKTRMMTRKLAVQSSDGASDASVPLRLRIRNSSLAKIVTPAKSPDEREPVVLVDDRKPKRRKRGRPRKTVKCNQEDDATVAADSLIIPLKLRIRKESSQNNGALTGAISSANSATIAGRRRGRPRKSARGSKVQ